MSLNIPTIFIISLMICKGYLSPIKIAESIALFVLLFSENTKVNIQVKDHNFFSLKIKTYNLI